MGNLNKIITIEEIHKEIDLIQGCIKRMENNSFIVKGWTITLITVLIALLADKINIKIICILSAIVILCFWYLDALFLKTERLFRMKYKWIIKMRREGNIDFLYDLDPYNSQMWIEKDIKKASVICTIFSKTLVLFYSFPLLVSVIVIIFNYLNI